MFNADNKLYLLNPLLPPIHYLVLLFLTLNSYMQFSSIPTPSQRKSYGSKFDLYNLVRPKHITKASGHTFKTFLELFVTDMTKVRHLVMTVYTKSIT